MPQPSLNERFSFFFLISREHWNKTGGYIHDCTVTTGIETDAPLEVP